MILGLFQPEETAPPREPTPEPEPEPAPPAEPVKAQAPPAPVKEENAAPPPTQNGESGLNLKMSAKEMKEMLKQRKKADPKSQSVPFKTKYEVFQKL